MKTNKLESLIGLCVFPEFEKPNQTTNSKQDPKGILRSGQLHPEFKKRVETLLREAQSLGFPIQLLEGYRDLDRQRNLLDKTINASPVTKAGPGLSFHNYGLAVDIGFLDQKGQVSWDNRHPWSLLGQIGKDAGLVWGGDFKSLKDLGHFQYPPEMPSGRELKNLCERLGFERLWEVIR